MSDKIIKFSDLGRKEIKAIIYEKDGEVITAFDQDKIKELQKTLKKSVIVYTVTPENRQKIIEILNKGFDKKDKSFNVSNVELLLTFIPMLTNIVVGLDINKDREIIDKVLQDPNEILSSAIDIVSKMVLDIANKYSHNIENFFKLPKENREKMLNEFKKESEPKIDEKEEKIKLLTAQIEDLKKDK